MHAGILRHRVRIEAPVEGTNEWGEPSQGWETVVDNLAAEVRDIRGREYWQSGQVPVGEVTTRVRVRYRPGIARQMRVIHGDRVLSIEAVIDPDGRRTELHLMCREVS